MGKVQLEFSQAMMCKLMSGRISCCKNSNWDERVRSASLPGSHMGLGNERKAYHYLRLERLWCGSIELKKKKISKIKGLIKGRRY